MSGIATKIDQLIGIPNLNYEGYIWFSDQTKPIVLNNEKFDFNSIKLNPFIVEGLLFNRESNISIHILHTGTYNISKYELDKISSKNILEEEYLPHRIENIEKVCFKQIWEEKNDPNCEEFPVLTITALVFCGFKKQ
jgi:CRISPR type III-associated protein (TIGR04423 family)